MKSITIDIILIGIIILVFSSYFIFLNPVWKNQLGEQLKLMEDYAVDENWTEVLETAKNIKEEWKEKRYILMFNFASEGFSEFESHLNYIIGGAMARELNPTLGNILDIQDLWENMNKILPEP